MDPQTMKALSLASRSIREATAVRDHYIREARKAGATLRDIGEAAGMTAEGVRRLLARNA